MEELLDLASYNIEVVNESRIENFVKVRDWYIGHFNRVSKHSAYTVKNIMTDRGVNIIQAHVHRLGMHALTYLDRTILGYEGGCLCGDSTPGGCNPNWQSGFIVMEPYDNGLRCSVFQVFINKVGKARSFIFNGKRFSKKEA